MSLGGIAIAIGAMVDAAIVMVENAHKRLEQWEEAGRPGDRTRVLIDSAQEVGKPLFFSLLIITVSFLPIFTLEAQEGRLFQPLAFTKTFAMFFAAFLSITLAPVLMVLLIRGRIRPEARNPINRLLIALYAPVVRGVLRFRKTTIALAVIALMVTYPAFARLGSEFMPPLNEGMIFYMPTTLPGISVTQSARLLQMQDRMLKTFPEVQWVFGKAGRAETSTDPAPFSMGETTVMLKPESQWRPGMTWDKLVEEMDKKIRFPGVANAWTMPIKNRIDMLSTGIRTPVGIKIFGLDLTKIEEIGRHLEMVLNSVPGTRSVFAERVAGGYYLDFDLKRGEIARYGLVIEDIQTIIESAIGGESITTTVEGRERYPVSVRYARELRDDPEKLMYVVPLTLLIIFVLLYMNLRSATKCGIVLLAIPFSMIGAIWFVYLLGYNMSVAVWVGIIALAGVDAETGVIMLLYLDQAFEKWRHEGRMRTAQDLREAITEGAVKRIRPKMMTVMAILFGLLPIMWSHGAGADVMKRIAAPMIGGVISSFLLELMVYPAIYEVWRGWEMRRSAQRAEG